VTAVGAAIVTALGLSGRAVANELHERQPEIETRKAPVRRAAASIRVQLPATHGDGGGASADSTSGSSGLAGRVLGSVVTGFTGLMLALGFAALGLAEADDARRRLVRAGNGSGGMRRMLAAGDEAVPTFRRYVWVKSLTSAITGLATFLAARAFDVPLGWVWGFLGFLLEYVPTVGSRLAVIPPVLMALAEGGVGRAGVVLVAIGGLQIVLGNVVDPRIEGR